MGIDFVSADRVSDPHHGVSHPVKAVIWIGRYAFEASEPADWDQALRIAAMSAGTVAIPATGVPGSAWWAGARRLARLVLCSCGAAYLDPRRRGVRLPAVRGTATRPPAGRTPTPTRTTITTRTPTAPSARSRSPVATE
jgi:hypothetical protein